MQMAKMTSVTKNPASVPFLIFSFHFQSGSPVSYCPSLHFTYKEMSFSAFCRLCCQCVVSVLPAYPCTSISVSPCQARVCMLGFDFWTFWLCLLDWLSGLLERTTTTFPLMYAVYPTETYSSLQKQMSYTGRYTLSNSLVCELNSLLQSNSWCSSVPLLGNVCIHYSHYSPKSTE